ncbi:MAG: hypothetical protein HC828_05665 [Blastochloris sp.]|nr:hypothetical protein [Blastochloris sp.]
MQDKPAFPREGRPRGARRATSPRAARTGTIGSCTVPLLVLQFSSVVM